LDYTCLRGSILPPRSFADWIARINDLKRTLSDDDYVASVEKGLAEALESGTTTIFNVESFPEIFLKLQRPRLRVWWFLELLDIRNRKATEELLAGALAVFDQRPGWLGGSGLSPHAPYTTSLTLYRLAAECAIARGMPFMTHLAETQEEYDLFVRGTGKLYSFLSNLGRDMSDVDGRPPFERLLTEGALPKGAILTHMNHLSTRDWQLLADRSPDFSVVHCPRCHSYFDRPPFPLERFMESRVNLCLGTDSLASNRSLSMFAEMRHLLATHPFVQPGEALRMATMAGARAIGREGELGEIREGAFADLIALPLEASSGDPIEALVHQRSKPHWRMIDGEVLVP
jgi:cytosine/adenosine deaminase-related metal-dependent hydrolase